MNLWAEVSFLLFVLLYLQKKLLNSSAISLIFEFDFDFPFMINVSGFFSDYFYLVLILN